MSETENSSYGPLSGVQVVLIVAVIGIAAGAFAAPQVYSAVTGSDGTVAVIELEGTIDTAVAQDIEDELREARQNDSVQAVVLEIESGGGLPAQSERIYAAVDRTAAEMPVIAAVDSLGASGAYLSIVPADEIYVAPSAQAVGSVGVAGLAPQPDGPDEGATGPDKTGSDPNEQRAEQQILANLFVENVLEQRGDEIAVDRTEIARAKSYLGTEAVENGFADDFGFVDDAIADAAEVAGLERYDVETHRSTPSLGLEALLTDDGEELTITDAGAQRVNPNLILAVAPEAWDETVGSDIEIRSYSGTIAHTIADGERTPDDTTKTDTDGGAK